MRDKREPWYDSDDPTRVARGFTWRSLIWLLAVVLGVGAITGIVWGIKTALAPVKGAGDVYQRQQDAKNRIAQQQHFQALYNQLLAYDQQLDQAAADKAEHPGDAFFATNYSGMVKTCIDARNQYNGDANKILAAQWRDETLPYQIDPSLPATDCKETLR